MFPTRSRLARGRLWLPLLVGAVLRVEVGLSNLVPGRGLLVTAADAKGGKQGEQVIDVE